MYKICMNTSVPTQNVCYIDFENNKFSVRNSANQKAAKVFETKFEAEEYAKGYAKRRKLQIYDLTNRPTFKEVPNPVQVIEQILVEPVIVKENTSEQLPMIPVENNSKVSECECGGHCGCAGSSVVFSPEIAWPSKKETLFDKIKKFFLKLFR